MVSDGYRNFRIRGIPERIQNRKQVRDLVRDVLQLDEDTEVSVHSLAINPLEDCSRVATLTFGNSLPKILQGPQTEWEYAIPDHDEDEAEKWGPPKLVLDTHFRGFTPLHRADDSECSTDLIAISGLGGHAFGSFKARGSTFMWLRDDLPLRLRKTRILVYGYDARVVSSKSFQNLNDLGNMFRFSVKRLQLGSSGCCQIRPTILIGHSLGGLIIKEAIIKMKWSKKVHDGEFLDNIIAFLFFGVPQQGMATEHLFPMVGDQPNRSLIQSLGKHSAILQRYEEEFSEALDTNEPPDVLSFYETEMSPTAKFNEESGIWEVDDTKLAVLADRSSATNGSTSDCAIARNHSEMVKFTSEMDEMYDIVLASLLPLLDGGRIPSRSLPVNQRECLNSLFFDEQSFRQAEIHDAENTCAWILDDPQYQCWIRQPRGLLWIKGKPGAGKSVLMKYASEKLREKSSSSRELVASFYIHGRGVSLQKTTAGVYRAILQDLIPHFDDVLSQATASFEEKESRYGSYQERRWTWAETDLEKILLQLFAQTSSKKRIVIFIDALDECEKDVPIKILTRLKRFGERIEQQCSYAKICFSSRHYPILGQAHVPTIVVEDKNREDIRQVMEEKLTDIEPDKERQRIVDVILSKDDGVFQWAVLVADKAVKKYLKGFDVRAIQREVETLPAELDSLYAGLLDDANEDEAEKVQTIKLFRWVLFACRPLSVRELQEALATDPHVSFATISELREHDNSAKSAEGFKRRVIDMSKGLIQFNKRDVYESFGPGDESSDCQVEFIHQSVPDYLLEYFLKPAEALNEIPYSPAGRGHFELSRSCLRYLKVYEICDAFECSRVDISIRFPLVEYATRYLFTHVQRVEAEQVNQSDLAHLFDWDDETKSRMAKIWRTFDPQSSYSPMGWPFQGGTLVHNLAALGSISAFKAILCWDDIEIDRKDSYENTPLFIAIRDRHHGIAQELLDRSTKWLYQHDRVTGSKSSGTLDVNSLPTSAKSYVVDVNAMNYDLETPMIVAVSTEASGIICTLIEAGASLKSLSPAESPLFYSIRNNNKTLLNQLIKHDICLDGAVCYAVVRTASMKNEDAVELVQVLLKAGANTQASHELVDYATGEFFNNQDAVEVNSGSEPRAAVDMGNLSILRPLLAHGSQTHKKGRDALELATLMNNQPMFELLFTHKARMGSLEPCIHAVLATEVAAGNETMTKTILDKTAEMDRSDSELYDALAAAARSGKVSMAELLLNHRAIATNRKQRDLFGALLAPVVADDDSMARAILQRGSKEISVKPEKWAYALQISTKLDQVIPLHNTLNLAIDSGNAYAASLLLRWGLKTGSLQQEILQKHLAYAAGSGDFSTVELLFIHGVSIDAVIRLLGFDVLNRLYWSQRNFPHLGIR